MDRREFIGTVAGGLLTAPLAAEAQPAKKAYRMGYLSEGKPIPSPQLKAFEESLRELGYEEGKTLWSSGATPSSTTTGYRHSPLTWSASSRT
jgi:hypothetical protein